MESRPSSPPFFTVTEDDHAGWIVVISVVFFIYSLLSVAAKIIIQFRLVSLKLFDYLVVFGTVILFVQTVLVVAACNSGLGKHVHALDVTEIIRYNQASGTHDIL